MTQGVKVTQNQIEGKRRTMLLNRKSDITAGRWVPRAFKIAYKAEDLWPYGIIFIIAGIIISLI